MRAISAPSRRHSALCGGAASAVQMPLPLRRRAPHTVRRHGPHLGALLHKIRREEGRTGSPKTARAPLPLGGEGAGACRAICERYRHGCHCTRRRTLPPPTSPAIRSGDSLSLSLSFAEQSQCDGTAVQCGGGGVRNSSSGGCICEFAKCIERDRRARR